MGILAVLLLVFANGFFVAAEFALVSVRRSRIEQLVKQGNWQAKGVSKALEHLDMYVAATQLGITMASLGLGFVGEPAIAHLVEPLFGRFLPEKSATISSHTVSVALSFLIVTALHIVLGELAPKSIALQRPDSTALIVTAPLNLFLTIFRPFIIALNETGNLVVRMLGMNPVTEHGSVHSVEELELIVDSTQKAGLMEEQAGQMMHGVFDLADTTVAEVMTPRVDVIGIEASATVRDALVLASKSQHLSLPVYANTLDDVVGVAFIQDLVSALLSGNENAPVRECARPTPVVPETKRASKLITELRQRGLSMAVVRDEFGGTAGIVTIEDLTERILGEGEDEPPAVTMVEEGVFLVDGSIPLEEINQELGTAFPFDETHTIGGFVFSLVGHQPQINEKVTWKGYTFIVEALVRGRIRQIRLLCPK